jgi:hypothetical protein
MRYFYLLTALTSAVAPPALLRDEHAALSVGPRGDISLIEKTAEHDTAREHRLHGDDDKDDELKGTEAPKRDEASQQMRQIVAPNYAPRDVACPIASIELMKLPKIKDAPVKCANECDRHDECKGFIYECEHKELPKLGEKRVGFGHCQLLANIHNTSDCVQPEDNDEVSGFPIKSLYTRINPPKTPSGFLYYPRLSCFPTDDDETKQAAKLQNFPTANKTAQECADQCEAEGCWLMIHGAEDPDARSSCAYMDGGSVSCKYFRAEEIELVEGSEGNNDDLKKLEFGIYTNIAKVPGGIAAHADGNFAELHAEEEEVPEDGNKSGLVIALISVSVFAAGLGSVMAYQKLRAKTPEGEGEALAEREVEGEEVEEEEVQPEVGTVDE